MNKNIFNCKDVKLQMFAVYQFIYWLTMFTLKLIPINIEEMLKENIIVTLSGISVAITAILLIIYNNNGEKKNNGVFIIFCGASIGMLLNQIK